MAPTDWFRSPDWGEAAERDFRHRLARARPHNQIQYRRIKAVALLETRDPAKATAGRRLLSEVAESADAPDFEKVMALSMLGQAALRERRLDEAAANLREALRIAGPKGSGTSGLEEAWLAHDSHRINLEDQQPPVARRTVSPKCHRMAAFRADLVAARGVFQSARPTSQSQ
jgi:hypothetical protein